MRVKKKCEKRFSEYVSVLCVNILANLLINTKNADQKGRWDTIFCFFGLFFGGLEFVGHSFAYVANFVFLRDVWIRTQRAAVASRRATNLVTRLHT
jgi:hypothetical protein